MSATVGTGPIRSFQSRLNRVAEAREPIDAAKPEVSVLPDWKKPFVEPSRAFIAAFIGAVAVLCARAIRSNFLGGSFVGDSPDTTILIDGGLALLLGTLICFLIRIRSVFSMVGQLVGLVAALLLGHNVVHVAPGLHGLVYSDKWTSEIVASAESHSLLLRGEYVQLAAPKEVVLEEETEADEVVEEEAPLPRVIRLQ